MLLTAKVAIANLAILLMGCAAQVLGGPRLNKCCYLKIKKNAVFIASNADLMLSIQHF